jgi:ABC-type Zn uptake system ZnuABC Zn-binding protein ZnuA
MEKTLERLLAKIDAIQKEMEDEMRNNQERMEANYQVYRKKMDACLEYMKDGSKKTTACQEATEA